MQVGSMTPRATRHAGKAKRSRSASVKADWPVRAGSNLCHIASSKGCRRFPMLGVVLARKVHMRLRPCVKAA